MTRDLIYEWGQWLADASPRRVTATTIADYQQHMRAFAQWMATELDQPFTPDAITPYRMERYAMAMETSIHRHQRRHATYNKLVTICRLFGTWLVEQGYSTTNPARRLRLLPEQPTPVRTLSPHVIRRMRDAAHHTGDLRDAVVIELLATTGMRAHEVARLRLDDLTIHAQRVWVQIVGKGAKYRRLPLSRSVVRLIDDYRHQRATREGTLPMTGPLLVGERGGITRTTINRTVTEVAQRARLSDGERHHVTPHAFRHTVATRLARTHQLVVAADVLGHQSLATTRRYVKATADEVAQAMDALAEDDLG